jgi:peptidoglycan/xylan/chitin deacetylase (PgdA/CDA1 family)
MRRLAALLLQCLALEVGAGEGPVEVHQVLDLPSAGTDKAVALTLDACGGGFDRELIQLLIDHRVPATIFATRRWLDHNPSGLALVKAHSDLFEIEDHGARHVPAVIGADRRVYGILGHPDIAHLQAEVIGGAEAVGKATGVAPRWYRAATAEYDPEALTAIADMGFKVAGVFSQCRRWRNVGQRGHRYSDATDQTWRHPDCPHESAEFRYGGGLGGDLAVSPRARLSIREAGRIRCAPSNQRRA